MLVIFFVAFLGGVSGLFLTAAIANACVYWFRIPNMEGQSGYFVVFTSLGGGFAGLIVSFITALVVAANFGAGFSREFGSALGVELVIAGVATILCRWQADIPPKIDGQEMNLEVEFRFPAGTDTTTPPTSKGQWWMQLDKRDLRRNHLDYDNGQIDAAAARLEDGRWIVPATVFLSTGRGKRIVGLSESEAKEEDKMRFNLPVPAHPGKNLQQWSEWLPLKQPDGTPWPSTKISCRFRIQFVPPPPPPKTEAERVAEEAAKKEAEFAALPADAPLSQWLEFVRYEEPQKERALQAIAKRPNLIREIEELAGGEDTQLGNLAIQCLAKLPEPTKQFNPLMERVGREIADQIRKVNAIPVEQDPHDYAASDIGYRFTAWHMAISKLRETSGGDFTPELKTILELSRVRTESRTMRFDVCRVASYYLREWAGVPPLPTDPPPR